jgi:hypothetical protein
MHFKSPTLVKLFIFFALAIVLQSCGPEKPGTYRNEQIKSSLRADFHALNDQLFIGLKANNVKWLSGIMSQEFIDDGNKFRTVDHLSNRMKEDSSYTILDEYYVVNETKGKHTVECGNRNINNYKVEYIADTREMYLVFFAPKVNPNRWLIAAQYNKLDYGWKLTAMDVERYVTNGKTAPELYELAKEKAAKNCLVDAADIMAQAIECLRPAIGWEYPDEKEMADYYGDLVEKVNKKYDFPYTLSHVKTQPQIFRVFNQKSPEGVFPMIYYLSDIKLKDTTALKKENEDIRKVIGEAMPGIDKDKKYVFYSVFNQMPDGTKAFDHFDITEKLQP